MKFSVAVLFGLAAFGSTVEAQDDPAGMIGALGVSDVEAAFGLEAGALYTAGEAEFDAIQADNYWTDLEEVPYYLSRFVPQVVSPRQVFMLQVATIGRPMLQLTSSVWVERFITGCYYAPRSQEVIDFYDANMLEVCNLVSGFEGAWNIVGYVNTTSILVSFSADATNTQYMTQLGLFELADELKEGEEVITVTMSGPNSGAFTGHATPDGIDISQSNIGKFYAGFKDANLAGDCPDEVCGNYLAPPVVPQPIPNPLAPAWPQTALDNQCEWWPNANVCDNTAIIGIYSKREIEEAFGLGPDELIISGEPGFEELINNNSWTPYNGVPLNAVRSFLDPADAPATQTFRAVSIVTVSAFGASMLQVNEGGGFTENLNLGCQYLPRDESVTEFFATTTEPLVFKDFCIDIAGARFDWDVVGYVDDETVLLYFGSDKNEMKYLTQLSMWKVADFPDLEGNEVLGFALEGPNFGRFAGYATPYGSFETGLLFGELNTGKVYATLERSDLSEPCPEALCGYQISPILGLGFEIPNTTPDAWPARVLENQCEWWPKANVCDDSAERASDADPATDPPSAGTHMSTGAWKTVALAMGGWLMASAW
jgi:hypothetical protein